MEAGDDKQGVVFFNEEKEGVGKTPQERASHGLEDEVELPWISAHALDHCINFLTEAPA